MIPHFGHQSFKMWNQNVESSSSMGDEGLEEHSFFSYFKDFFDVDFNRKLKFGRCSVTQGIELKGFQQLKFVEPQI